MGRAMGEKATKTFQVIEETVPPVKDSLKQGSSSLTYFLLSFYTFYM
jgi:hypothetical protein